MPKKRETDVIFWLSRKIKNHTQGTKSIVFKTQNPSLQKPLSIGTLIEETWS